jgi:hypothetical protein
MAMNMHITIEELLEAVFKMQSMPKLYGEEQQDLYWVRRGRIPPL